MKYAMLSHAIKNACIEKKAKVGHSHVVELLAKLQGFKSHAAFMANLHEGGIIPIPSLIKMHPIVLARALELEYPDRKAKIIADEVVGQFAACYTELTVPKSIDSEQQRPMPYV